MEVNETRNFLVTDILLNIKKIGWIHSKTVKTGKGLKLSSPKSTTIESKSHYVIVVNIVAHWKGSPPLNDDLNLTFFIIQSYNITSEEYIHSSFSHMHCFLYNFRSLKSSAPLQLHGRQRPKCILLCSTESIVNFAYTNSLIEPFRMLEGKSIYEKKIKEPDRQIGDKTGLLKW